MPHPCNVSSPFCSRYLCDCASHYQRIPPTLHRHSLSRWAVVRTRTVRIVGYVGMSSYPEACILRLDIQMMHLCGPNAHPGSRRYTIRPLSIWQTSNCQKMHARDPALCSLETGEPRVTCLFSQASLVLYYYSVCLFSSKRGDTHGYLSVSPRIMALGRRTDRATRSVRADGPSST
ncbi:hypothetical protein BD310DRAFT_407532 [Dichomitus squalens]|uniref:Uncharacterized protein n=1 Tax=Dichomitus squalens TaxID=114155 RepID=A0A4Q9PY00_9APHY|nr:hypothetical protein BD310DRAFT_407532 [Dichomitus squalens]